MPRPHVTPRRLVAAGIVVLAASASAPMVSQPAVAGGAPTDPPAPPVFERIDIDTQVSGASFSVAGEVFEGEQDVVTSGYGALSSSGVPKGGGTVQIYRPGASLREWTKIPVITPADGIIFPNQVTLADMDDDGDLDLLVPSGYFFDTGSISNPQLRSGITWWENQGLDGDTPRPFVRHDVITGQAGSYHGVQHVDLDGDGIEDLVTTSEEGRFAPDLDDDTVTLQVLPGLGDGAFGAPVAIGDQGGSIPVVADVDGDDDLDIVSSQYFGTGSAASNPTASSFLWWEQSGDLADGIEAGDFTVRPIAAIGQTGPGFQIRPVPDFRGDGELAWVGTNHTGRCTFTARQPDEAVLELTPGDDVTQPWTATTLSIPEVPDTSCPPEFKADRTMIFPGDSITSRAVPGQAAPGVFGHGDVDGDGDTDLVVAGDGDHRLFWVEQRGDGSTRLHTLTGPDERFGQSGGAIATDFDGNGTHELVFSSFDRNTVALWRRVTHEDPIIVSPSTLTVAPGAATVAAGRQAVLSVGLDSLDTEVPAEQPSVQVVFVPARTGVPVVRGTLDLERTGPGAFAGTWRERVTESGRYGIRYVGRFLDPLHQVGSADAAVRLTARTVLGFRGGKVATTKPRTVFTAAVLPAVGRTVRLQRSTCTDERGASTCSWTTVRSTRTARAGAVRVAAATPQGRSRWRLVVVADASGTAATSLVRTVVRR